MNSILAKVSSKGYVQNNLTLTGFTHGNQRDMVNTLKECSDGLLIIINDVVSHQSRSMKLGLINEPILSYLIPEVGFQQN